MGTGLTGISASASDLTGDFLSELDPELHWRIASYLNIADHANLSATSKKMKEIHTEEFDRRIAADERLVTKEGDKIPFNHYCELRGYPITCGILNNTASTDDIDLMIKPWTAAALRKIHYSQSRGYKLNLVFLNVRINNVNDIPLIPQAQYTIHFSDEFAFLSMAKLADRIPSITHISVLSDRWLDPVMGSYTIPGSQPTYVSSTLLGRQAELFQKLPQLTRLKLIDRSSRRWSNLGPAVPPHVGPPHSEVIQEHDIFIQNMVKSCPRLRYLDLEQWERTTPASFKALFTLTQLEGLRLTDITLPGETFISDLAARLPRLRQLALDQIDNMSQENLKNISAFSDLEVLKLGNNAHINDEALAFLLAQLPKLNHLEITATVPAIPQTWHAFQRLNPNPTAEAIKKWEDRYEIINEYNPEGARKLREDTTYPEPTAPFGPAAFNSLRLPELENITFQFLDIGTDLIKKIIETCPNLKIIKLISCPPLPAQIIDIHDSEESRPKVMEKKPWR